MKLIKKTKITDDTQYYDLSIEKTHNYCLSSGVVVHNCGAGISVQRHHVEKLPYIKKPNKKRTRRFLIGDSIEGWADSIKILMRAYFEGLSYPIFDYGDIRPKGAALITSGGKAPGPAPLRECICKIQNLLDEKEDGDKLRPMECHEIVCHIADAVLAGGIRRAAVLSLFSLDDEEMLYCKTGNWYETKPHLGRANNTIALMRHLLTEDVFFKVWDIIQRNGTGEPAFMLSNDRELGQNPCAEILLASEQFCDLTEINASNIENKQDLHDRVWAATVLGTLQAGYTDFHYLRDSWKKNSEKDALIGVSMTGIASGVILNYDLQECARLVKKTNEEIANLIGIKPALRSKCIKPSGTTSILLGTSSGIHAWHAPYYIRRIRIGKNEPLYTYLLINHPELVEDEYFRPHEQAVISVPQKAPDGAILRTESPIDLLERIKKFNKEWIREGHTKGANTNNVSATVSIKPDEWDEVGKWLWKNRRYYNGISFLPYDGSNYIQAPFEEITKERYEELFSTLKDIDLTKVIELEDVTDLQGELACSGGNCELR